MLLPEEWRWLGTVTKASGDCCSMTGKERAVLYATAIQTELHELRSSELRSVTKRPVVPGRKPAVQEAGAVAQMRQMLFYDAPEALRATGTDDNCQLAIQDAQRMARRAKRCVLDATGCETVTMIRRKKKRPSRYLLRLWESLCERMRKLAL